MELIDFKFDDINLSDKGLIVASFDSGVDSQDVTPFSLNTTKAANSNKFINTGYQYEEPFSKEFSVCKNPCDDNIDVGFTSTEIEDIIKWLNRKNNCKFIPVYRDETLDIYFMGTFTTISIVKAAQGIIGLNLTFTADAPYGYYEEKTFTSENNSLTINDISGETGFIYCDATIVVNEDGDLTITNSLDNSSFVVKNCTSGEIITIDGDLKYISSTNHSKLYNDFNYNFIKVINDYGNNTNEYTSNLNIDMTIKYSPIRKVGFLL